jgi:hypothetical protein
LNASVGGAVRQKHTDIVEGDEELGTSGMSWYRFRIIEAGLLLDIDGIHKDEWGCDGSIMR